MKDSAGQSPWLGNRNFDLIFILSPAFISTLIVVMLPDHFLTTANLPLWAWVIFILGIDVTHVYSTVFRTYLNSNEFRQHRALYIGVPALLFVIGVILYSVGEILFWRVLAYAAVFHFVRQQYGFLRIYARKEEFSPLSKLIDQGALYSATLFPIIYWHAHLPRKFNWFVDGDFINGLPVVVSDMCLTIYILIQSIYIVFELNRAIKVRTLNWPKNLLLLGTNLSWYVSIVRFNSDMAFSVINVVSHGIPYIALIWIYGYRQQLKSNEPLILSRWSFAKVFKPSKVFIFIFILIAFAYVEEGLWDALVWREHTSVFKPFLFLSALENHEILSWIVPLLTLPQVTHYVLDGLIWKVRDKQATWQTILLSK